MRNFQRSVGLLIKRLLNKETFIESMGIVTGFTILQRLLQIGRGIVFARLLSPKEYGIYNLAFLFIPLLVIFAKLGIPSCYERYVSQYEKSGKLSNFFKKNYALTIISAIVFSGLCLLFLKDISKVIYGSLIYKNVVLLCTLTILPYVLYENFLYSFNGLRIFKMHVLLKFAQFLIFSVLGVTLIIFYRKAEFVVLANLISFVLVAFIFGFIVFRYILNSDSQTSKIEEDGFYSKIFRYSIWFVIIPATYALFRFVDRWMLNYFLGLHEVGIYSVAINITSIIFTFGLMTTNVLLSNLSKMWESDQKEKTIFMLNLVVKISTLFLLALAVVLIFFKKHIITILYGEEYIQSIPIIGVLSAFWLFNSIFLLMQGYSSLVEKTHLPFIALSIGLVANIILNYFLIPHYKIMGAAVSCTIASVLILVATFILNRKEGMTIKSSTYLTCMLPSMLFLDNKNILFIVLLVSIAVILGSEFIITSNEKKLFHKHMKKLFNWKYGISRILYPENL